MKKHQEIIKAQNEFKVRRESYLKLNHEFFLNFTNQLYKKAELPNNGMIKYKYGTDDNSNIVEDWLEIDDNGNCAMRISVIANDIRHDFWLSNSKDGDTLKLEISNGNEAKKFAYDLTIQKNVAQIEFESEIDFIIDSAIILYDRWRF